MKSLDRWMPHFVGIGAMRSGTSWLSAHLARHPAIWLRRKELHFFDRKMDRRIFPLIDAGTEARMRYCASFVPAIVRGQRFGEFTPAYAVLEPDRIAEIHTWMPEVKILYIMRDPVERAWSQAKHDFPRWLGTTAEDAPRSQVLSFLDSPKVRMRSDYATCLTHWLRHFDRRQFFLTFLEDVADDPERVLHDAFSFLEVDPDLITGNPAQRVHASNGPALPEWVRDHLASSLHDQNERLETLVGRPLPWVSLTGPSP